MRKIFLLICIAAFTSSTAQENDLFDISKHLEMKKNKVLKKLEHQRALLSLRKISRTNNFTLLQTRPKTFTVSNGDRVITNPAYRMPVVVPDMKRFQIMPNPGEDYFVKNFYVSGQPKFNDIPNGALPDKIYERIKNRSK